MFVRESADLANEDLAVDGDTFEDQILDRPEGEFSVNRAIPFFPPIGPGLLNLRVESRVQFSIAVPDLRLIADPAFSEDVAEEDFEKGFGDGIVAGHFARSRAKDPHVALDFLIGGRDRGKPVLRKAPAHRSLENCQRSPTRVGGSASFSCSGGTPTLKGTPNFPGLF